MPPRLKREAQPALERDESPTFQHYNMEWDLPQIGQDDSLQDIIKKLSRYFVDIIELPSTFEQLRTTHAGEGLVVLVDHLGSTCTNRLIVAALLALRWHYMTEKEHRGLSEARANACEIVAWRFLTHLPEREAVDYCLYEIPGREALDATISMSSTGGCYDEEANELSPLLGTLSTDGNGTSGTRMRSATRRAELMSAIPKLTRTNVDDEPSLDKVFASGGDLSDSFKSLNALEIAAIANAKRFLSQYIVQKIITGLWNGEIIFWDSVSATATRAPRYYNPRTADPYSRLRVPKYLKTWEMIFFMAFLALYYSVVVRRSVTDIPLVEKVFYIWLVAFLWDEFQEWADAGIFYLTDLWNLFDMTMIAIGIVFATLRVIGIAYDNRAVTDTAFDILSLEALLVIPRICSFLSLSPYWGTLIPCLKEMGKDFIKFMILVIIIYLGFLTTFSLVARDTFDVGLMTWDITKIFYGNTSIGFRIMNDIDARFGPPLMILFITLSSILLTGSLTGMLSNSFSRVMAQSREEYLYVYSIYVLEASTSSRLTHFLPPFNLIALVFFRPWRIIFPKDDRFRHSRVVALKVTHFPIVTVIILYEWLLRQINKVEREKDEWAGFTGTRTRSNSEAPKRRAARPGHARNRNSGSLHRPVIASPRRRRYSEYLHAPEFRPGSASRNVAWAPGTNDQDTARGPTNAELLSRIEKLTAIVTAIEERQRQGETGQSTIPFPPFENVHTPRSP